MPNLNRRPSIVAALSIAALALVSVGGWLAGTPQRGPGANDGRDLAQGEALYNQHCASCHGTNLEGQANWTRRLPNGRLPAPPHDASGHTWHHPTELLFLLTKNGLKPPLAPAGYQSDMPAFADVLSDAQIRAVLDYIKSRWPEDIRARHRRLDEAKRR